MANEYYLDKLNREKAETVPQQPISVPSITTFAEGSILKIKRRKNEHVYVGTGDMQQNSQDILKTGKRRKFTDEGNYFEESSDRVENHSTEPTLLLPIEAESANASPSKSKEDIESNPPPRKGQRIGFGALASLPPRTVNETKRENFQTFAPPCTTCAENLIENQEFDSLDSLKTEHQSSRDNSSGIVITESGLYDDLSDSDDENCISQEELLEESLLVERERQKRIFSLLHESISASVPSAVNFDQTTDPHEIEAVPIIEPLRKNPFRNSTWSQTILRFDPLRHKQSQQYLLSPEEVQERDKSLARTHNPLDTEGTADLEKLKGIFHRDGGLGWDSSGKGVIQRDPEINERIDNLILEAERFGFDVRGESDTNNQEKENGSSMVFGFFDGPQEDSDSEHHGDESSDDAQSSDDNSEIFTHEEENESSKYHNDEEHIFHYPSYEEVLAIASRFKRDLYVSTLILEVFYFLQI